MQDEETSSKSNDREERAKARAKRRKLAIELIGFTLVPFLITVGVALFTSGLTLSRPSYATEDSLKKLDVEIGSLKERVSNLHGMIGTYMQPPANYQASVEVTELQGRASSLEAKVSGLEEAIEQTPEKTISVALLRKDVGDLGLRISETKADLRALSDHFDQMQKWIIGGIVTGFLGMVVGVVKLLPAFVRTGVTNRAE
jgi:hypothetical protein